MQLCPALTLSGQRSGCPSLISLSGISPAAPVPQGDESYRGHEFMYEALAEGTPIAFVQKHGTGGWGAAEVGPVPPLPRSSGRQAGAAVLEQPRAAVAAAPLLTNAANYLCPAPCWHITITDYWSWLARPENVQEEERFNRAMVSGALPAPAVGGGEGAGWQGRRRGMSPPCAAPAAALGPL